MNKDDYSVYYTYDLNPEPTEHYKIKIVEFNTCPDCGGTLKASPVTIPSDPPQYEAICKECGATFGSYFPIGKLRSELLASDIWKIKEGSKEPDPMEKLTSKIGELKTKLSDPTLTPKEKAELEDRIARLEQWQDL